MAELIFSTLAVYGVTTIITEADGPFGVFYKLRQINWLSALQCFICASVYVAAVTSLFIATNLAEWLIFTFGLSGAAILAHKLSGEY